MASYTKRGDTWSVRFRITENTETVQKRLSGFTTKKEAHDAYAKFTILQQVKPITQLTIGELFELCKEYKKTQVKYSSFNIFCMHCKNHILPYFSIIKAGIEITENFNILKEKYFIPKTKKVLTSITI
jgi:hypothetical protein